MRSPTHLAIGAALLALVACGANATGTSTGPPATPAASDAGSACSGPGNRLPPGMTPSVPNGLRVPTGFTIETIASVPEARELAALPDGDLIVGTSGSDVYVVPDAEAPRAAGEPRVFAKLDDVHAAGVAFAGDRCRLVFATEYGVWTTPYRSGDLKAENVTQIAKVRTGPVAPGSDGDVHVTTSVAYWKGVVYASVGSSCNAYVNGNQPCEEVDPTRAAILQMDLDGTQVVRRAHKLRNGIALTIDPATGALWAGDAGQDDLPFGHPYEFLDDVSARTNDADYGWPQCEENHHAYVAGSDCSKQVVPRAEMPAYSTIIGDAFYPVNREGAYRFPARYRGVLFATAHGSWHRSGDAYVDPPHVVAFAMDGNQPERPVDWNDPKTQWRDFVSGFQSGGTRIGRPTGIAVGSKGSLFVADDDAGVIYRIRPAAAASAQ